MNTEIASLSARLDADMAEFLRDMSLASSRFSLLARDGSRGMQTTERAVVQSTANMKSVVQNFAFQVQDLAVQIGGGTSAFQAFGQQLPQMLGGFGALGAGIGAAVAILGPLAANLFASQDATTAMQDATEGLADAIGNLIEATKEANAGADELRAKYGMQVSAVEELKAAQRGLAEDQALNEAAVAYGALFDAFERFRSADLPSGLLQSADLQDVTKGVITMMKEIGATREEAVQLQAALRGAMDEKEPIAQANALARVREVIGEIRDRTDRLSPAALAFAEAVAALEDKLRQVHALTTGILDVATNLPSQFYSAAAAADAMSPALQRAIEKANQFNTAMSTARPEPMFTTFDPVMSMIGDNSEFPLSPAETGQNLPWTIVQDNTPMTRPGGGGTTKTEPKAADWIRELETIQKQTLAIRDQIATFNMLDGKKAEWLARAELVRKAEAEGIVLTAEQKAQIDAVAGAIGEATAALEAKREAQEAEKKATEDAKKAQEDYQAAVKETIDDLFGAVKGADSFEEALTDLGLVALKLSAQGLLGTGPLAGLFGGLFGGGGSSVPNLASNPVPGMYPRAGGGHVNPGSAYLVGERGPEWFRPPSVGSIEPVRGGRGGMGGGGVTVVNNLDASGNGDPGAVMAGVRRILDDFEQRVPAIVAQAHYAGRF